MLLVNVQQQRKKFMLFTESGLEAIRYAAGRRRQWNQEYENLLTEQQLGTSHRFSLAKLLKINAIYQQYAEGFLSHPDGDEVDAEVEAFARKYGIWIEDEHGTRASAEAVTMTKYLARRAVDKDRLRTIGKINIVAYAVDDTIANEFQKKLTPQQADQFGAFMGGFLYSLESGEANPVPAPQGFEGLSIAMTECMDELRASFIDGDPTSWMSRFTQSLKNHLKYAVMDHNTSSTGQVISSDRYYELRKKVSGMEYTNILAEYAINKYIDLKALEQYPHLKELVLKVDALTIILCAFLNDYFSPEKEIFDEQDEFNLIANLLLNDPDLTLCAAILKGAEIINHHTDEFFQTYQELEEELCVLEESGGSPEIIDTVRTYSQAMRDEVFAAWVWQIFTKRYLRDNSIFEENNRDNETLRHQLIHPHGAETVV